MLINNRLKNDRFLYFFPALKNAENYSGYFLILGEMRKGAAIKRQRPFF
jgi:hypothetical protein